MILAADGEHTPKKKYNQDAGADLFIPEDVVVRAGRVTVVDLELKVEIPKGFMGLVLPRGGCVKRGIIAQIPVVDAGYRGSIHAMIFNTNNIDITVSKGERLCSIVVVPIVEAIWVKSALPEITYATQEQRDENRFNSTGTTEIK